MKAGRKPEYPEKTPGDELQKMSVFPARGDWSGRLDSIAGGGHQSRRRTLQPQTMSSLEVGSEGRGQRTDLLPSDKTRR